MLRITVLHTPGTTQLKLEGKLTHECVEVAAKAWHALEPHNVNTSMVVDLMNVSFVDAAGHELLAAMRHAGAKLIGCGPMMSALLEEIEETETEMDQSDRDAQEVDQNRKEIEQ